MKKTIKILKKKFKNYNPKIKEECGVFGISNNEDASTLAALGLHALQHRGQEGCGIVSFDGKKYHSEKRFGLVGDNFNKEKVLKNLLRIGKSVIISIPNFGYWKVRTKLLLFGEMPVTKTLPNTWYNTPNLHMCTIKDLFNFCDEKNIIIKKVVGVNENKTSLIRKSNLEIKNLFSKVGIFLIS